MTYHNVVVEALRICTRKGEGELNNTSKFLAIGLILGGGIGIVAGALMDSISMGIVFGGGGGLIIGLAIGAALDRQTKSKP